MKQLVCIGCPRGCRLTIEEKDGELIVTGNTCPRGKAFAVSEMTEPRRTICSPRIKYLTSCAKLMP